MINGKCSKKYHRAFTSNTITGDDGYPRYRKRLTEDGGRDSATVHMQKGIMDVDNRWVIPYSLMLSKTFKTHINVEYCISVKLIKCICKYGNKGRDMAVFGVQPDVSDRNAVRVIDEISQWAGRYISSNEVAWRIFSFPMHERNPAVIHLSIHFENVQGVYFTDANVHQRAINPSGTTLTAFFTLCQEEAFIRTLLYSEVPSY
ncbi:uncharacterized protein LOC104236095 [Trichonephila clavata]|uniref:Uncharacterized protein LOC104236095 n=1 Tax=Trichonephila clavata TaxID=2740835 RepID=A0A8X6G9M1_TRICU|nr:uncharacterized protein LOC104236095 [Trichonephila clavata]